jgi:hypothetical protein
MNESFLDWYARLWASTPGDSEEAVRVAEERLGVRLPSLLRALLIATSRRRGEMLHLHRLDELVLEEGVLVFAYDQQDVFAWGVPVARLQEDDPPVVTNFEGPWLEDGCSLEGFLRGYALLNRPYAAPFVSDSSYDQELLQPPWQCHEIAWRTVQLRLWVHGGAVLEPESGNIGARDLAALRASAMTIDIDEEEMEAAIVED